MQGQPFSGGRKPSVFVIELLKGVEPFFVVIDDPEG